MNKRVFVQRVGRVKALEQVDMKFSSKSIVIVPQIDNKLTDQNACHKKIRSVKELVTSTDCSPSCAANNAPCGSS